MTRADHFSPTAHPQQTSAHSTPPAANSCASLRPPRASGLSGRKGEVLILCSIHLFDRDHPSAPTCALWPSRAAALKDGALQRHRRLVLERREHGGMINAQGGK